MTNSTLVLQDNYLESSDLLQSRARDATATAPSSSAPTSPSKRRNPELKLEASESPRKLLFVSKKLKIRSLLGVCRKLDYSDSITSGEMKAQLCKTTNSCFRPSDILVVSGGRELRDEQRIAAGACIMVHSVVDTAIDVPVTFIKDKFTVGLRSNMKIFQVKRALQAVTKVPPSGMRLILGGLTLDSDAALIGDYVLHALSQNKRLSIVMHKVLDTKKLVDVRIWYDNGKEPFRVTLELGQELELLPSLLHSQYGVPVSNIQYIFTMKGADGKIVPLQPSMTLVDVGVTGGGAAVELEMYRNDSLSVDHLAGVIERINVLQKRPRKKQADKQASKGGLFAGMKKGFLSSKKR